MNSLIFENYGFYPQNGFVDRFSYQGWEYHFIETTETEELLNSLAKMVQQINVWMQGKSAQMMANRKGEFAVEYDGKTYVMWAIPSHQVTWEEVQFLHFYGVSIVPHTNYPLQDLITLWEGKVEFIESKCIPSIRIDEALSSELLALSYIAIGLAENAIQYVADLRLDEEASVSRLTLTHRRFLNRDAAHLLDPLNWVYDSPVRDLAMIYLYELMPFPQFVEFLDSYKLNRLESNLLMARLLYPSTIFDLLEQHYMDRVDIRVETHRQYTELPKTMHRLINFHLFMIRRYQIRPIPWLINYYS